MLDDLRRLSARIGRDIEQVQAAGGNTSLKDDGLLWVKASGLWLADAEAHETFVPVRLDAVLRGIESGSPDPTAGAVVTERNPAGLRPSIETTLHALLPHRVVVQTHSVRTIAVAVRTDAEAELERRLAGLAYAFAPYRQPGLPLTLAVAAATGGRSVDVVVLGNHGLVVGADDVAGAETMLAEVERRLDAPLAEAPRGDGEALRRVGAALGLKPLEGHVLDGLATVPPRLERAAAGSYYPDHLVFLGPRATVLPDDSAKARPIAAAAREDGGRLFLVPGVGVLLDPDANPGADALAACLGHALGRVPDDARLNALTPEEEAALMNWDAEKYRQGLARARGLGREA